jgi:hypothetical protein
MVHTGGSILTFILKVEFFIDVKVLVRWLSIVPVVQWIERGFPKL